MGAWGRRGPRDCDPSPASEPPAQHPHPGALGQDLRILRVTLLWVTHNHQAAPSTLTKMPAHSDDPPPFTVTPGDQEIQAGEGQRAGQEKGRWGGQEDREERGLPEGQGSGRVGRQERTVSSQPKG